MSNTITRIAADTRIVSAPYHLHDENSWIGAPKRVELTASLVPGLDTLGPLWKRLESEVIGIDPLRRVEDPQRQRVSVSDFADGLGSDLHRSAGRNGRVYRLGTELRAYWIEFRDPASDSWYPRPVDADGAEYDA